MKTDELREKYLDFFVSKGCIRRPSDVLVPHGDKSVLFTPAGMNQFKNQFLGIGPLEFTKATTCQKCLRTGDIGNVGVTAYHHTFFEMLGNFSFGDYFKREAIHWAWEFLTDKKWLGMVPERLSVTVYLDDDEAFGIWEKEIGLPAKRIQRCDEGENFWPANSPSQGPDGVCGPCSEIYYHPPTGGKEVEIWNLVFTQFNRVGSPPNNLQPLPKNNIDTGMGLERCAAVLQGVESNFEIDTLRPLCEAAGNAVGVKYQFQGDQGRPLRRIADHIRAVTMCVHEGVVPSNEKQGYIVRLLLRRALLEGYLLGKQDAFLYGLVPAVVEAMKRPYPDLVQSLGAAADTIKEEEQQFLGIIERGLSRFQKIVDRSKKGDSLVTGEEAFELHTQEGFLIEMTEAMAARHGMQVDLDKFQKLLDQHRETSGRGSFSDSVMAEGPLDAIRKTGGTTEFLGYDSTTGSGKVIGIISNKALTDSLASPSGEAPVAVVLDRTPFYGETGGQVGDVGTLKVGTSALFDVIDTQRDGDLVLHVGHLKQGKLKVGDAVQADASAARRAGIRRAHSATHLLHFALRKFLGPNAQQRGSLVDNDTLRFDFSHKGPMTPEEITQVEDEINARIAEGAAVSTQVTDQETARQHGAMMLFGEKYPDKVRMVTMGDFSVELCGGTHLSNTGQVGLCRIISEEGVAKGVRRIVAYTGHKALDHVRETENLLKQVAIALKVPQPKELPKRVEQLQAELAQAKKDLSKFAQAAVADSVLGYLSEAEVVGGAKIVCRKLEGVDRDSLRMYADALRQEGGSVAVLLAVVNEGKVTLLAAVTPDLVKKGVKAGDCVRDAAKLVGGGGGGRPDLAEAGGKDPSQIDAALAAGAAVYRKALGG
ncbi:alanine--tRNA ligase [Planctomicrobium piriforme]|uniref:Alanine--tRNA ligase n=1 Tax=Planctomicrobium piriforme TaxID=1576369 RepID=A0A1I3SJ93_9PLAN|nr:alanine--tRNA ligase [Planctomicrobium piriforme]SFJ57721.1 alanyl-tRNA synthetase [Planctomicrobium piriforme]